ncbi:tetratricopeptide repeat protein [Flavobacteriaceae bacterium F08102]|nr:tetratricopeptide repeat protein [Flavobacteriaceae bacterium F08102]
MMNGKLYCLIAFLSLSTWMGFAQQSSDLFAEGNRLYQEEKYSEALAKYQEIEQHNLESDALYFNMANAYYKLNKIAPAVYYYEKVLQQNPLHKDAKFNLSFAKRMAIDNIEPLPKNIYQKFRDGFILKLSYDGWAWLAVSFAMLASILFLWYYFTYRTGYKRLFFVISIVCASLTFVFLAMAYQNYQYVSTTKYAIVYVQEAEVKTAPSVAGEVSFDLHEGTKVKVLESLDNWKKISIADGREGWIVEDEIREL